MGAERDTGVGLGRTFGAAFQAIAEERAYDYGHAGYTGTFAETPGAVLLGTLPARMTWQKFETAIERQGDLDLRGYWYESEWGEGEHGFQTIVKKTKRRRSPWPKSMQTPEWQRIIAQFIKISDIKWEPAAAVRLNAQGERDQKRLHGRRGTRDRVYYFAATCSS